MTLAQAAPAAGADDGVVDIVSLPDGRTLTARKVTRADVDGLDALFEGLSDEDRHYRFFNLYHPARKFIERMTRAEDEGGYRLVAVVSGPAGSGSGPERSGSGPGGSGSGPEAAGSGPEGAGSGPEGAGSGPEGAGSGPEGAAGPGPGGAGPGPGGAGPGPEGAGSGPEGAAGSGPEGAAGSGGQDAGPHDTLVAEAGYAILPDGDGEFDITVASGWRGWLGPYLLDALVAAAAARGVPRLQADVLLDNVKMFALVAHRGYKTLDRAEFSEVRIAIDAAQHR
ncbi:MAG TPA: hypothetical protein VLW50_10200 [Streptosporangiaceae bacterium]|nr:hypothetical protein [Streptosporangiaceae bacterium]